MSRWLVAAILSSILVACGTSPQASAPPATPPQAAPAKDDPGAAPASLDALLKRATTEGTLNIVSSGGIWNGAQGMKVLQDAFNAKYNTNFSINYAPGPSMPEIAVRLVQEVQANQEAFTDLAVLQPDSVLQVTPVANTLPLGLFPNVPKEAGFNDNRAIRIMSDFFGMTYNTKVVAADQAPRKLEDLLDPKWRGKIATTPYAAGFQYATYVLGPDKTRDFVRQFAKQITGLIRCGEEERVASGEFAIFAMDCGSWGARQQAAKGAPIDARPFDDVVAQYYWYAVVPKTSAHPALASLFAAFLASKEGQSAFYKAASVSDYLVDGTPMSTQYAREKSTGVKILDVNPEWSETNKLELAKYQQEFTAILREGR
jgi:iron(III) transport system substrate-binding protein